MSDNYQSEGSMNTDAPFFSKDDHQQTHRYTSPSTELASSGYPHHLIDQMTQLQYTLSRRLMAMGSELQATWDRKTPVSSYSHAANADIEGLTFSFVRPRAQATLIEKLMGRGAIAPAAADPARHPVLEVRLTPDQLVVELILSPLARWDQRNFAGKMRVERHRDSFRSLLCGTSADLFIGFWNGENLQDAHLTCRQLLRGRFLEEWFGTFSAEHDWLRIGVWSQLDDPSFMQGSMVSELSKSVVALAQIYKFMAWSSENDFHSFLGTGKRSLRTVHAVV
ncbi:MAG: hypothetical protein IPK19_09350 [Chloroflexi bacterium]|nr:hypothetical protein [Chloroflexota bacterium]